MYKSFAEWLDIGIDYTAIYGYVGTGEDRLSLSAIMRGKISGRDVSNRLRIEYRDINEQSNRWRFRNKLRLNREFEELEKQDMRF